MVLVAIPDVTEGARSMIWLKRLFNAPLLLKLHWDHTILLVKIQQAQKNLHKLIERYGYKNTGLYQKHLEKMLEDMTDLDERMLKLWSSGHDSKKD